MTKTLEELLNEGVKLVPIFSDLTCTSFKIGFYYNGIPHAISRQFKDADEAQQVIDEIFSKRK